MRTRRAPHPTPEPLLDFQQRMGIIGLGRVEYVFAPLEALAKDLLKEQLDAGAMIRSLKPVQAVLRSKMVLCLSRGLALTKKKFSACCRSAPPLISILQGGR